MVSEPSGAARGAFITVAGQAIRFGIQILGSGILSRLLPPDAFGAMAIIAVVIGAGTVIGDLGLSLSSVRAESSPSGCAEQPLLDEPSYLADRWAS